MSAQSYVAVAPSDTVNLPFPSRAIYVGVAGDIVAVGQGASDGAVTFKAVPQGWNSFPWPILQIKATGTLATNIVASAF